MEFDAKFTDEAIRLLGEESNYLIEQFRSDCIKEALTSRGEPIEVTASDVKKVRKRFVMHFPMIEYKSNIDMLLRIYFFFGIIISVGGLAYPYIEVYFKQVNEISKTSFLVAISGLLLSVMSGIIRYYLKYTRDVKLKRFLEREDYLSKKEKEW